jgi:hypothetical protein
MINWIVSNVKEPDNGPNNSEATKWLKDISNPEFSTPSFNPDFFNPRLFNHEFLNPVVIKNPGLMYIFA